MAKLGVFVSWSGDRSKLYARHITEWLPAVLPGVDPWMSERDIRKGERWSDVVGEELKEKQIGIFCVTPENMYSRWLYFEAGALSKFMGDAKLFPLLFVPHEPEAKKAMIDDLGKGPLGQYQATNFGKDEMLALVKSLNQQLAKNVRLKDGILAQRFENGWEKLAKRVATVPPPPSLAKLPMITPDELLEREKNSGNAMQKGLLIIVNSREPVEANSPEAAKVVLSNIERGVVYDYFFDSEEANAGAAANLVQTLSLANKLEKLKPSPLECLRLMNEYAPDVKKNLTELLLGHVRIHFRRQTPFHFCIHNAITLSARCYLRYDVGPGFVEWYTRDSARFVADELRKSRIEQNPIVLRSRVFHSTGDCNIDAVQPDDQEKQPKQFKDWLFKEILRQEIRDRFPPGELQDVACSVCFGKAEPVLLTGASQVAAS
ncbi:MAG TPA: toll/interleukin-1 receptor domain-containing protein [Bryobacteraceae bacterium]